jgi:uncharacterized protein YcbK (DUF882 family)
MQDMDGSTPDTLRRPKLGRRHFLKSTTLGVAAATFAPIWTTELLAADFGFRELSFHHLHTGESLAIEYMQSGEYVPDALRAVDHILRDHYNGAEHPIDPDLLDILHAVADETGTRSPFRVISGYRSPETNERLRRRGGGVARNSMHLKGRAVDIRLDDVPTTEIRDVGLALKRGGVGYYRNSDFVHLDTGRVRRW